MCSNRGSSMAASQVCTCAILLRKRALCTIPKSTWRPHPSPIPIVPYFATCTVFTLVENTAPCTVISSELPISNRIQYMCIDPVINSLIKCQGGSGLYTLARKFTMFSSMYEHCELSGYVRVYEPEPCRINLAAQAFTNSSIVIMPLLSPLL